MQKLKVLCFGKLKLSGYKSIETEFKSRLSHYAKLEIIELEPKPVSPTFTVEKAMEKEGHDILAHLEKDTIAVLLDSAGNQKSSQDLAVFFDRLLSLGRSITFIIGSSNGVSEEIRGVCNHILSFGKLTFPNDLARIILLEQIYRSYQIINNTPYHK